MFKQWRNVTPLHSEIDADRLQTGAARPAQTCRTGGSRREDSLGNCTRKIAQESEIKRNDELY
jgi:hypothetical protein